MRKGWVDDGTRITALFVEFVTPLPRLFVNARAKQNDDYISVFIPSLGCIFSLTAFIPSVFDVSYRHSLTRIISP